MPVTSKHPDFLKRERDYTLIDDCIEGQRKIKKEGEKYLPRPNPEDTSEGNLARYEAYKKRAVFHNVTARTVGNMVGQCFAVEPVPTLPDPMLPWLEDIDGSGVSATQQAKRALGYVVSKSRAFLWVDYPKTAAPVSQADAEAGAIRPRIILCHPCEVINWRVMQEGAKVKLSLVVIRETYIAKDDGFEATFAEQYRVLRLDGQGKYFVEVHRPGDNGMVAVDRVQPLDGQGNPFSEIPATFIGAESNNSEPEKPLMLDIANLNVAHYRNSADYEEAVYMLGQPTPYLAGLSDAWVRDHLKNGIFLGSRECIPLPQGATAGMLQASPNTLPKEAMDQKETLMQALGAKLVEKSEVAKTATESGINEASETSILASCCSNVSAAYGAALRWAAQFGNIETAEPEKDILYELNTDFAVSRMSPDEVNACLSAYNGKLITWEEMRDKLKNGGWAYLDDETAKDQLQEQADEEFTTAQKELAAQTASQKELLAAKAGNQPPADPSKPGNNLPPAA